MKAIKSQKEDISVSDALPNDPFSAYALQDISALGLRHVGYAIPTELFAPFVSSAVETVRGKTTDEVAESAFRWSLTLRAN